MDEIWRDVHFWDKKGVEWDYTGLYQISNKGRIKSLNYKRTGKEKIIKPSKNGQVCLCSENIKKWFYVDILLFQIFHIKNINYKYGIVFNYGINDMERGWRTECNYNKRVYQVWANIIQRCYSERYHERQPCYKGCTVCERWLYLSNFVEDICKIDGYDYWLAHPNERVALDKDIKSNGKNKCYCLENCCFTTIEENCKQANKTRDNSYLKSEEYKKSLLKRRSQE